ncbi:MAG: hypothetical protein M1820_010751 [Bogoriella megaspora]|nr:MAG: hypothetical protein M1820_010751 [Bogoriella megaspora]
MSQQRYTSDNLREHQQTEQHLLRTKRQRVDCPSTDLYSSSFWDGLSKIWLTKGALKELDRRNSRSVTQSTPQQVQPAHQPVTQISLKNSQNSHQRKQTADEFLHNCTPESLKTVKSFARIGGIDLSDLRGSSRPKDANYQQKLIDGNIFPYGYEFPDGSEPPLPDEWDELHQRIAQPRLSLSPSIFPEEEYRNFIRQDARAPNEDAVKDTVLPAMLRTMGASDGSQKNVLFNNLDPLVPGISQTKPDYYYGAQPEQIHQQVRNDLSSHIIPSTSTHFPAVPNFCMEAKGPLGTNREALLQACNVGAIGTRAMHSLESYQQDALSYHGKVSAISSTYNGGLLKIYGHSVARPDGPGTQPHYYMHQLKSAAMTDSKTAFLQGAAAFKNARDWTEGNRNAAIASANAIATAWTEGVYNEKEEAEEEEEAAASTQPSQSFAYSTLGREEDAERSAKSQEEDLSRRPPDDIDRSIRLRRWVHDKD